MKHCDASSCKAKCKNSFAKQCDHKLGKIVPTCQAIPTTTTTTKATLRGGTTDKYFQRYGAPLCDQRGCYPAK